MERIPSCCIKQEAEEIFLQAIEETVKVFFGKERKEEKTTTVTILTAIAQEITQSEDLKRTIEMRFGPLDPRILKERSVLQLVGVIVYYHRYYNGSKSSKIEAKLKIKEIAGELIPTIGVEKTKIVLAGICFFLGYIGVSLSRDSAPEDIYTDVRASIASLSINLLRALFDIPRILAFL